MHRSQPLRRVRQKVPSQDWRHSSEAQCLHWPPLQVRRVLEKAELTSETSGFYLFICTMHCLMPVPLVTLRGGDTEPNLLSLQNASRVYSPIHSDLCGFFLLRSNIRACVCSYVCVCVKLGQGQRSRIQQRR